MKDIALYLCISIYHRLLRSSLSLFMSLDHGQPQVTETKGGFNCGYGDG